MGRSWLREAGAQESGPPQLWNPPQASAHLNPDCGMQEEVWMDAGSSPKGAPGKYGSQAVPVTTTPNTELAKGMVGGGQNGRGVDSGWPT